MDKYQTRSISSNFFSAAKSTSTLIDDTETDTAQVDFDTVDRGGNTTSALTQNPSEPILTNTEDLEFKTVSEALESQEGKINAMISFLDFQSKTPLILHSLFLYHRLLVYLYLHMNIHVRQFRY